MNLPGNHELLLTRRHFLYGVAGVAAIAAVGGAGVAFTKAKAESSASISVLTVAETAVTTLDAPETIEDASTAVTFSSSISLPYGSIVWSNDENVAACLIPTDSAKPLAKIGLVLPSSGTYTTVVEHAVGEAEGFEIYDVRACSNGLVWAEADILDSTWRIYHATLNGTSVGTPTLAEEGTLDWEMPTLAAVGSYAFWQVLPRLDGNATQEDSLLKRARFGSGENEVVYASHGRMASVPSACEGGVVISPRADASSTYYQLTRIDAHTGLVTDALTLPASMKPFEVGYGQTGFMFSFEGIYSYGGGIANLGTYTPATKVDVEQAAQSALAEAEGESGSSGSTSGSALAENASENGSDEESAADTLAATNAARAAALNTVCASAYSNAAWLRVARTPTSPASWCGNWLMIRFSSNIVGFDPTSANGFTIDMETGANDYGDYLASTGSGSSVVTFSNVDYTPLGGDQVRHCLVRVWKPAS